MGQADDAWNDVGEQLKTLGSMFKSHYRDHEGDSGADVVSDDEVKEALRTLGDSVKTAFASIGDAFADHEIRAEARQTASSFFDALGATFSEFGTDISKKPDQEPIPEDPSETD